MQVPSYAWPYKSGALGVFLTIFAVVAYDLNRDDSSAGFMVGYVTALAVTTIEVLRTRHSYKWTWLKFLNAMGGLGGLGHHGHVSAVRSDDRMIRQDEGDAGAPSWEKCRPVVPT